MHRSERRVKPFPLPIFQKIISWQSKTLKSSDEKITALLFNLLASCEINNSLQRFGGSPDCEIVVVTKDFGNISYLESYN